MTCDHNDRIWLKPYQIESLDNEKIGIKTKCYDCKKEGIEVFEFNGIDDFG